MSDAVERFSGESAQIVQWAAGDCHGLVWANGMALLDGSLSLEAATRIWEATGDHLDLSGFLEELSLASGARILAIPSFAVAIANDEGWHVAARGPFEVRAECRGGAQDVGGAGVSTWSERLLEGVSTVSLVRAGADHGQERPTAGGIVPASRLRWGAEADDDVAPAAVAVALPLTETASADEPVRAKEVESLPAEEPAPAAAPRAAEGDRVPAPAPDPFATLMPDAEADLNPDADVDSAVRMDPGAGDEEPEPVPPQSPFAHLWGDTVMHRPTDAAVREVDSSAAQPTPDYFISGAPRADSGVPPPPPPSPTERIDVSEFVDHDGQTVMASSLGTVRTAVLPVGGAGGRVLGIVCGNGHANPPQRTHCRVCGVPVSGEPEPLPRPALGWLRSTTGEVVELSTPVIAGRNPRADRVQGPQLPRLLALPHSHISGNHLEIRLEGWNVLAVDLRSTNGTFLRRHGEPPVRLPESPVLLIDGDVLDLGHGVQLVLEELP